MKCKRKSPKAIRQKQAGIIRFMDNPFVVSGSLNFGSSFHAKTWIKAKYVDFFYDTGIQAGDWITISTGSYDESVNIDYRKVHVARRRQSKGKTKKILYEVQNTSATCITVKDTSNGIYATSTITCA